jgi:hypothetical protein
MNTEQKTPIEWFQQLKEPYRSEAINNLSKKMSCYIEYPDSLIQALNCSFAFADSNEGKYNYWWEILRSIKAGETTYLETETELKPQDMISGEWYVIESVYNWIIKFKEIIGSHVYVYNSKSLNSKVESIYGESNHCNKNNITLIRPATREEVLEHFPDEFKDEKKEVESELKEGEVYFYSKNDVWMTTISLQNAIDLADSGIYIYRATPIGTKQTKSILEPIKTK